MTSSGYNLPFVFDDIELSETDGNVFWKQLLPLGGRINYKGESIVFDRDMLNGIASSYADKAYDLVPFQLANDKNEHPQEEPQHMDPRKTHGYVKKLKVDNKGLWGQFHLNEDGKKAVADTDNKLGVSVSVKRGYQRADGKTFPYALRHVLGTLDPKVTGMDPWSTVEMSNADENEEVTDLTGQKIETPTDNKKGTETTETVTVPKEQWDDVMAYIRQQKEADAEFESMMADKDDEDTTDTSKVEASNEPDPHVLSMSNDLAAEKFERYADGLVRQGVPPVMLTEARKILGKSDLMDFSNDGGEEDPRTVIRNILEQAKGTIDLSEGSTHRQSGAEDPFADDTFKAMQEIFGTGR
jgi:hypothetical protein